MSAPGETEAVVDRLELAYAGDELLDVLTDPMTPVSGPERDRSGQ